MKLRKKKFGSKTTAGGALVKIPEQPKLIYHHQKSDRDAWEIERRGHIDPQLGTHQYFDDTREPEVNDHADTPDPTLFSRRAHMIASLSSGTWNRIAGFLDPTDAASLSLASSVILQRLGWNYIHALDLQGNELHKAKFLVALDQWYPNHLFCPQCDRYHRRLHPGKEEYKTNYILDPVMICPNASTSRLPRMRLAHGRELPYAFVQLACRASRFTPAYGITSSSLDRRWKSGHDNKWLHHSRFIINNGHLLMRVTSTCTAPPGLTPAGQRLLLFTRQEYEPYFSACAHWRDGDLMDLCKCALGHIPAPYRSIRDQVFRDGRGITALSLQQRNPNYIVRGCGDCAPMRRCPLCPSEYLIGIRMVEDTSDLQNPFKHALSITRWCDLGDGSSPSTSKEWASCLGEMEYNSFEVIGTRAISGIFEAGVSQSIPGERLLSLNPNGKKKQEDDDTWY